MQTPEAAASGRHGFPAEQAYVIFMVFVTPCAALAGLVWAVLDGAAMHHWVVFAVWLYLSTIGITAGLHRLFSHRSFVAARPLELALAVLGTTAGQDFFLRWIYVHRLHHRYTDQPGDPHSPWFDGERSLGVVEGLLHAHNGWLFRREPAVRPELIRDLLRDPALVAVDRWSPAILAVGVLLPGLIALVFEPTPVAFGKGVLIGGFLRLFVMYQLGWGVNSFGHRFGRRLDGQQHHARNNAALGLLAFGDGWHANHHEHPGSARHGFGTQVDVTWWTLVLFERLGWVRSLRVHPPEGSDKRLANS